MSSRTGTATTFAHAGLKNTSHQSSSSGAVTANRVYDAFGNVVSSSGTWQGPFGYAGNFGYQEDGSGLKLLGHRYYDSSTGRFLTKDPAKSGRNWCIYVSNDPISNTDPTGLTLTAVALFLSKDPFKDNPNPFAGPTDGGGPWPAWLMFILGTGLEEFAGNPVPSSILELPLEGGPGLFNNRERKRQQYEEQQYGGSADSVGEGTLRLDQDPQYWENEGFVPGWTK